MYVVVLLGVELTLVVDGWYVPYSSSITKQIYPGVLVGMKERGPKSGLKPFFSTR